MKVQPSEIYRREGPLAERKKDKLSDSYYVCTPLQYSEIYLYVDLIKLGTQKLP